MALSIKNVKTERLARELAAQTGQSVTSAVTVALRERLREVRTSGERHAEVLADLRRIAADAAARWPASMRAGDRASH